MAQCNSQITNGNPPRIWYGSAVTQASSEKQRNEGNQPTAITASRTAAELTTSLAPPP
jgi:hypothetical protein